MPIKVRKTMHKVRIPTKTENINDKAINTATELINTIEAFNSGLDELGIKDEQTQRGQWNSSIIHQVFK